MSGDSQTPEISCAHEAGAEGVPQPVPENVIVQRDRKATRCPAVSYVVGVGASAGGLDALEKLFKHMPADAGMAFVVVQHLSPDFKSMMDELLARHTSMAIHRTTDGMEIAPNSVYLIPPRKAMVMREGRLWLSDFPANQGLHLPIDVFFHSLAEDIGPRAIAIVLSGTGTDGTRGVRAVKEADGLLIVQDESTAQFDGMPRSAIATGLVDLILPPERIGDELLRFVQHPFTTSPRIEPEDIAEEDKLGEITRLLRLNNKIDFAAYKASTLVRRIVRRMGLRQVSDLEAYIQLIRESRQESAALVKDLLIGVTRFFRDDEVWEFVANEVFSQIIASGDERDPIRCWVTACSTGEEAYTAAILLHEQLQRHDIQRDVKIFATDIDAAAIERASVGMWPENVAADVGSERLRPYFHLRGDHYEIAQHIREMVIFANHDLLRDPPFTKLDFVSCRNLLIYLRPEIQRRALRLLHFALKPDRFLLLGASETVGDHEHAFHVLHERHRVYAKDASIVLPPPGDTRQADLAEQLRRSSTAAQRPGVITPDGGPTASVFRTLCEALAPAGFLLANSDQLMHVFGDVSDIANFHAGEFSPILLKIVVDDLRTPLATALHRAASENQKTVYKRVHVRGRQSERTLNISVIPLEVGRDKKRYTFVGLEDDVPPQPISDEASFDADAQQTDRIRDLEHELDYTKENLQFTIEELESSNEELQSTNEELLASNEELQSTNEELHSVNEELHTVNAECQAKIKELTDLTNDFDNLLRSTDIGTIFVDENLCIRRFTPAVQRFVNLIDHDIGRPIDHLTHNISDIDFVHTAREVMRTRQPYARQTRNQGGVWILIRVLPFLTGDGSVQGAVITCVDVSKVREAESERSRLAAIVESSGDAILSEDLEGRIVTWNAGAARMLGYTADEIVGEHVSKLDPEGVARDHDQILRSVRARRRVDFRDTVFRAKDGRHVEVSVSISPLRDEAGEVIGAATITQDIGPRKTAQRARRHSEERLAAAIEGSLDAFCILSPVQDEQNQLRDVIVTHANARAASLVGRTKAELVGRPWSEAIGESLPASLKQRLEEVFRARRPVEEDLRLEDVGKDTRWVHWQAIPVGGDVALTVRDITDRKAREAERQEMLETLAHTNRRLQRSNEALERFASIASHDLKEPLRTIQGYCGLIQHDYGDDLAGEAGECFEFIRNSAARMQSLIEDLLHFSRVSSQDLRVEQVDLGELVREVAGELRDAHGEAAGTFSVHELPVIAGSGSLLRQAFYNLLQNAIKYRGDESPNIRIHAQFRAPNWIITVADNGLGIPPAYQERVFEIFRRVPEHADKSGSGVGLALVQKIIERHEGRIWVESRPGEGSTFYIALPTEATEGLG